MKLLFLCEYVQSQRQSLRRSLADILRDHFTRAPLSSYQAASIFKKKTHEDAEDDEEERDLRSISRIRRVEDKIIGWDTWRPVFIIWNNDGDIIAKVKIKDRISNVYLDQDAIFVLSSEDSIVDCWSINGVRLNRAFKYEFRDKLRELKPDNFEGDLPFLRSAVAIHSGPDMRFDALAEQIICVEDYFVIRDRLGILQIWSSKGQLIDLVLVPRGAIVVAPIGGSRFVAMGHKLCIYDVENL